jgi:hypothetical protein
MRSYRLPWRCRAALSIGLVAGGCGGAADDLPREAIYGKVTVDGEPLARGAIRFQTSTPGAGRVIEVGELIRDGEYAIPRDSGPVPGTYRVTITEEAAAPPMVGDAPGPRTKVKPSRIASANNTLSAEVKKGQSESIDFALKSGGEPASSASRSGQKGTGARRGVR